MQEKNKKTFHFQKSLKQKPLWFTLHYYQPYK